MKDTKRPSSSGLSNRLGTQFLAGIVVIVPIGITILILYWIFSVIDNILQPVISSVWGHTITGVGFGITILLIYLAGVLTSNVLGKRLINFVESLLAKLPIFRYPYTGIKQILNSFTTTEKTGFMRVVLVEFPRKGMNAIGFVTNESTGEPGNRLISVYIPAAPNPTSGFLQILREDNIIRTDIPVQEALEMVISAGRVSPKEVIDRLSSIR